MRYLSLRFLQLSEDSVAEGDFDFGAQDLKKKHLSSLQIFLTGTISFFNWKAAPWIVFSLDPGHRIAAHLPISSAILSVNTLFCFHRLEKQMTSQSLVGGINEDAVFLHRKLPNSCKIVTGSGDKDR